MLNFKVIFISFFILLTTGCSAVTNYHPGGSMPAGAIVTNVIGPASHLSVAIDKDAKSVKKGTAIVTSIMGLFAYGDSSIHTAMQSGELTRVHHIDHKVYSILFGFIREDTIMVYGD